MNEHMLNSLMRLFAIMVNINRGAMHVLARNFVETFLAQQFSRNIRERYLDLFDEYVRELEVPEKSGRSKRISSLSVKLLGICNQIVSELHISQRFMILLSLIRFSKYFPESSILGSEYSNAITDAVRTVSDGLLITQEEFQNCSAFIIDKFYNVPNLNRLLVISDDKESFDDEIRHLYKEGLKGQIFVLQIKRADIYLFQYRGKSHLEINGKYIFPRHVYMIPRGSAIRGEGITPVYHSDIVSGYLSLSKEATVTFYARNVSYRFRNSPHGIHPFSFYGRSGQLVGIIGGSGAGKSTLLKVLNGSLKLRSGEIYINGNNLHKRNGELDGVIGYVPQDDLLIEELTVRQNLWYNARLCLDNFSLEELEGAVDNLLKDLDLYDAKDLKVGSPLNKYISGGQRKRLNIALELVREPHVLFIDEPTSGLSSSDSENVVALLKDQALKGRLVVSTIHQPSSELFKQFDHLIVLDRGGYPVYSGNPLEGISYFKELAGRVDAAENECATCGRSNPDEILNVIEARNVDEFGAFTPERRISPEEWYRQYRERIEAAMHFPSEKTGVPENEFKVPSTLEQFVIFFRRNLLSKLADRQFMIIAMAVAPLLALILGYFSKYVAGNAADPHKYIFSQNENLPAYLFMSVIVALFLGMIIAAEEIIRDRRIREREAFLNLNRTSYLLAKVSFLFIVSALQMFVFVLLGNLIMEIRGMTFSFWLILFSTACFANLLGLNISDGLKSVVAIYVVVPFLLVPQILLAGVIVKFDKLHYRFASEEVVPLPGESMASRWAYEALAVRQFRANAYQRDLFPVEQLESNVTYDMQFLVPTLLQDLEDAGQMAKQDPASRQLDEKLRTIRQAIGNIYLTSDLPSLSGLVPGIFDDSVATGLQLWLKSYQNALRKERYRIVSRHDALVDSLRIAQGGTEAYLSLRERNFNEQLASILLNRNELRKIVEKNGTLVRKMDPVYMPPLRSGGRAHFYASVKRLGNKSVSTLVFNITVIWLMSIVLFILLQFSVLRKIIESFSGLKRTR